MARLASGAAAAYTTGMLFIMMTLAPLVAQSGDAGLAEPNQPVYEIYIEGEDEPLYGCVEDDDWSKMSLTITLDQPWLAEPETRLISSKKVDRYEEEWPRAREQRVIDAARQAGFELVNGHFYPAEEVKWAREARARFQAAQQAAQRRVQARQAARPAQPAHEDTGEETEPAHNAAAARQFLPHALIAACALALIAVVIKVTLFAPAD